MWINFCAVWINFCASQYVSAQRSKASALTKMFPHPQIKFCRVSTELKRMKNNSTLKYIYICRIFTQMDSHRTRGWVHSARSLDEVTRWVYRLGPVSWWSWSVLSTQWHLGTRIRVTSLMLKECLCCWGKMGRELFVSVGIMWENSKKAGIVPDTALAPHSSISPQAYRINWTRNLK